MLLANGLLITVNPRREIIRGGAIRVDGSRITAVGKQVEPAAGEEVVDLRGQWVIPGLVDTHVHLAQAMIRGCADDMALVDWLVKRVWVLQGNYTETDGAASARLCIAEMIKSGTTTFIESMLAERYGFDGIAEVVQRTGIRACLGKIVMDQPGYAGEENVMHAGMVEDRRTSIDNTVAMHRKWDGAADGRIRVWFGARTPGSCSKDLYHEVSALAHERKMGITIHIGEVRDDVAYFRTAFGQRPMEYCEEVGLSGPNVLLVHCCWLDENDVADCARTGTNVSHNPSSNTKLASGFMKLPSMLKAGVNVGLGCDGGPSNNSYDLIQEMKLAACIHKATSLDPEVVPAETVLEMATINGARALGLADEIGSIEPGKKADLTIIDPDKLRLTPSPNPVSTLVYAANGDDVDSVMVDGRWLMRHRKLLTLDEAAVIAEARERSAQVYERARLTPELHWPLA